MYTGLKPDRDQKLKSDCVTPYETPRKCNGSGLRSVSLYKRGGRLIAGAIESSACATLHQHICTPATPPQRSQQSNRLATIPRRPLMVPGEQKSWAHRRPHPLPSTECLPDSKPPKVEELEYHIPSAIGKSPTFGFQSSLCPLTTDSGDGSNSTRCRVG